MGITFDPAKNDANVAKHGLSLATAEEFEWETAMVQLDVRTTYGETRHVAIGYIGVRLHGMVFTRRYDTLRIISLRKANCREVKRYAET